MGTNPLRNLIPPPVNLPFPSTHCQRSTVNPISTVVQFGRDEVEYVIHNYSKKWLGRLMKLLFLRSSVGRLAMLLFSATFQKS
ncbi:hypothetical protein FKM82_000049 [Ascaphus truei]